MTYVVRQRGHRELRVRVGDGPDERGPTIIVEKWSAKRGYTPKKLAVIFLSGAEAEQLSKALVAAGVDLDTANRERRP